MANPGFRIKLNFARPSKSLVEQFSTLPVANIGDNMNRINCMDARIKQMSATPLLGCALTVRVRKGDNLLLHKAIDMAGEGDVVIVDAHGDMSYAVTGELMISWLRKRGAAGLIVDGCVRDIDFIRKLSDFPVYAAGVTPNGPLKEGGGEINFPINCGGIVVSPGDVVVGDSDGVVVIDPEDAEEILHKTQQKQKSELNAQKAIEDLSWDRSWVDKTLNAKGCEFID